jgi:uncharacterized protein
MSHERKLNIRCPICKQAVKNSDAEFPFCSERCRTIDLGKWASGAYVVPSIAGPEGDSLQSTPEDLDDDL